MKKTRELASIDVKGYKRYYDGDNSQHDVSLKVHGIFDTIELKWVYYLNSVITSNNNNYYQTNDISDKASNAIYALTQDNLSKGLKFDTIDEGIEYANTFKRKWESGRNEDKAGIRDRKISQVTDEK